MIEILWHGRGGQGAFTAARLLGAAGSLAEGRYALAFPSFGPERRGAPMRAFTKIDTAAIGDRSAIVAADFVVYLDDTLFGEGWATEVKPGGFALVNSTLSSAELTKRYGAEGATIVALDANAISAEILGRPIPNTVFLGAIAALSDAVSVEDLEEAVRQYMAPKLHEKNFQIIRAAADRTAEVLLAGAESAVEGEVDCAEDGSNDVERVPSAGGSARLGKGLPLNVARPDCVIPALRNGQPLPHEVYARTTCYEAGYLVSKNAGWRNVRPVIDYDACTSCLQCYMQCPDGAIFKAPDVGDRGSVAVDYDFCKGCGVCVKACSFGAISMVSEAAALAAEQVALAANATANNSSAEEGQVNA